MLRTVEVVAEELGISKAAVYKKLKSSKYKNLLIKDDGKMMVNEKLFEKLKSNVRKKKVEKIENVEIIKNSEVEMIKVESLRKEENNIVEILLNQIKEKDEQINRLHNLIENSQVLIKNQQEKEKEQLKLEEHFREIDKKLMDIRDSKQKKNKKRFKIF